jgi:hypothetical protein
MKEGRCLSDWIVPRDPEQETEQETEVATLATEKEEEDGEEVVDVEEVVEEASGTVEIEDVDSNEREVTTNDPSLRDPPTLRLRDLDSRFSSRTFLGPLLGRI